MGTHSEWNGNDIGPKSLFARGLFCISDPSDVENTNSAVAYRHWGMKSDFTLLFTQKNLILGPPNYLKMNIQVYILSCFLHGLLQLVQELQRCLNFDAIPICIKSDTPKEPQTWWAAYSAVQSSFTTAWGAELWQWRCLVHERLWSSGCLAGFDTSPCGVWAKSEEYLRILPCWSVPLKEEV